MKKYLTELIGTFIMVFVGCGAMVINQEMEGVISHVGVAMSWGLIIMVLVYTIGDVSGAHMNPAVTLGFWFAKRFPGKQVFPYILAQVSGALLASLSLKALFSANPTLGASLPANDWQQAFVFELFLTFLLMYVILHVSSKAKEKGIMAGAAVGATVGLEAMFAGPICGASMNPARSLGPALVSGHTEHLWVYLTATVLGALLAVSVVYTLEKLK
ncbi:MAG: MIP family channel protein [Flavobacteriales bacterium]|nr:MIP family channel protein [Flavobacteriales bacterium]